MCLKTDTIRLQYTFYQFQYFITTCLCMVEIYQEMFQSNSFNGNDLMVLFNWRWSRLINKHSLIRNLNLGVKVFSISDDALLVRAKRQNYKEKNGLVY